MILRTVITLLVLFGASADRMALAQDTQTDAQTELFKTHGRYHLQISDVIDVQFRFTPEFNQTVTVQPDGFVTLQIAGEVRVGGLTMEQSVKAIAKASEARLLDPEVSVVLKEFEKPYFVVGGEVASPGRFELRSPVTAFEAVAIAGGFTPGSKHSQALLFRRLDPDHAEVTKLDLKQIEKHPKIADEWRLGPGDMLYIPKNTLTKIERIVRWTSIGVMWNPFLP